MTYRRIFFGLFLALGSSAALADDLPLETAIKATYLYKFAPFVEWPDGAFASNSAPLQLCILGDDPFGGALAEAVAGQHIGAHAIAVLRLKNARAATGCHIAYIGGANDRAVAASLAVLRNTPVLTVTDVASTSPSQGVINFIIDNNHVRFDIDAEAAARNRLVISSKLMQLAHAVKPKAGG